MKPSQRRNIVNRALRQLEQSPIKPANRFKRVTYKFFRGSTVVARITSFNLAVALARLRHERLIQIAHKEILAQIQTGEYVAVMLEPRKEIAQ